eukprot:UN20504
MEETENFFDWVVFAFFSILFLIVVAGVIHCFCYFCIMRAFSRFFANFA